MKITLVSINYAPEPTGIAPYSAGLAEELVAAGHEVRVITGVPHYPHWKNYTHVRRFRTTTTIGGVSVFRLRHYVPPGGVGLRRLLMEIMFALSVYFTRWGNPDVVITVSPSLIASLAVTVKAHRCGIPVATWVQDFYSRGLTELSNGHHRRASALARQAGRIESKVLRSSDRVIVIHNRFRVVTDELLVDSHKVIVSRNWVHVEPVDSTSNHFDARSELGWGSRPVILHSGSMGHKQGLSAVVEAARLSESRGDDLLFVLMGDGSEKGHLDQLAHGCQNIALIAPLATGQYQAALMAADILLLNEQLGVREMALPSKLTTYFTMGKPVVAAVVSDGVSADEMRAAGAGVIVEPGDANRLLNAICALLEDNERGLAFGRAARRYAHENLEAQAVVRRFESILEDLVAGFSRDKRTDTVTTNGPLYVHKPTIPPIIPSLPFIPLPRRSRPATPAGTRQSRFMGR